jgi:hypothetical protein
MSDSAESGPIVPADAAAESPLDVSSDVAPALAPVEEAQAAQAEAASDENGQDKAPEEAEADAEAAEAEEEEAEVEVGVRRRGRKARGSGRPRRKVVISMEDDEDAAQAGCDGAVAPADSGADEMDEEELSAEKLAALKQKRALRRLREEQRAASREQFISAEELRRSQARQANRERQRARPNRALERSIALLEEMSLMASEISAVDLLTQPLDLYTPRHQARSHSHTHPSLHPHVSSFSRDYYPLYLEAWVPSTNWLSLEQQWADEVEEEAERGDKDKSDERQRQQQLASINAPAEKAVPRAVEDVACNQAELARDMAGALELQALRRMRAGARRVNHVQVRREEMEQLAAITTAALPAVHFPAAIPAPPRMVMGGLAQPVVIPADDAIDLTSSPQPPAEAECSPLFLPSADASVDPGAPLAVQVFRRPATTTPQFRRDMSALAYRIWDNVQWQAHHPPLFRSVR